jgi:hypothetical protein
VFDVCARKHPKVPPSRRSYGIEHPTPEYRGASDPEIIFLLAW